MLKRLRESRESEDGFTLIELLVVIIIIGILAAIAIPVFLNQRKKAVSASIKSDLRLAALAEETYYTDNQAYVAATGQSPKFSNGNVGNIRVAVTATGFCVRGQNAASDTGTTLYYWYDSTYGGLQAGVPAATSPSVGQTGATCTAAGTYTAVT